jgi:cytochrome c biogenesis protein
MPALSARIGPWIRPLENTAATDRSNHLKSDAKKEQRLSVLHETMAFFTSVRTTIGILFGLAAASIVGTVVPQQKSLEEIARTASPFVLRLTAILDLNNLYQSWWFLLLLTLLALNLLACLIQRTPAFLSQWNPARRRKTFSFKLRDPRSPAEVKTALGEALSPLLGKPKNETSDGDHATLSWVKQRVHLLGFPLMHAAIIIVLAGGLLGLLYGFKGHVEIPEGEVTDEFLHIPSNEVGSLPFRIAVDKFTLKRYPTGQPKEFRSDVRLLRKGKVVLKGSIIVNSPLTYQRISLYQADYRLQGVKGVDFRISGPAGENQPVTVKPGEKFRIPGTKLIIRLLGLDPGGSAKGAGAEIVVESADGKPRKLALFEKDSAPAKVGDLEIRFAGYDPLYATGLQIGYDPGSPLVWSGCGLLIIGFFLILFTNHRHLTLEIAGEDSGGTEIKVFGSSRRQRREFREAVEEAVRGVVKGDRA